MMMSAAISTGQVSPRASRKYNVGWVYIPVYCSVREVAIGKRDWEARVAGDSVSSNVWFLYP